jgi:alcohol dehydrogenase (cytochrome c)/quinohemoprotein ethanol dehydrogenase
MLNRSLRQVPAWAGLLLAGAVFAGAGDVNFKRLTHAQQEPGQWLSVGRTYDEQRYSPLSAINTTNVATLGLAWYADLDSNRGQEATPLFIDGVLYLSTAWSRVKAYDAASGKLLWAYDPKVPGQFAGRGCCDVVNRGVAAWNGKIYVASYDGRLIALSARTGTLVWEVLTVDHDKPVTSTGAPRVIDGKVVIGNAGGELGVRGYISAYDADSGKLLWRFHTVPANPADGPQSPIMQRAADTWNGNWWQVGGGAAVWDGIAYDPDLDLVYFGTGNGTPWNRLYRGTGGGDNLFVASIIALHARNGSYAWHYQETPGEEWDYDATSPLMLATVRIAGKAQRVLLQAAKNGFFYVLDAATGKVISAHNYVPTTWASGVDLATGRPLINPEARYDDSGAAAIVQPGAQGAHSWHPFSYNPQTGLVYFAGLETSSAMKSAASYTANLMGSNTGLQSPLPPTIYADLKSTAPRQARARLIAWDPVAGVEAWHSEVLGTIGSGTLTTAGGLVFQGTHTGRMVAYAARDGRQLWNLDAQTGVVSAPSTFELGGEQYIAQTVGYGLVPYGQSNHSRLLVLKLGGTASLPPLPPPPPPPVLDPPPATASGQTVEAGKAEFQGHCAMCHDTSYANRNVFPDLRYSPMIRTAEGFRTVVLEGVLQERGMASFKGVVSPDAAEQIRAYLIARANEAKAAQIKTPGP